MNASSVELEVRAAVHRLQERYGCDTKRALQTIQRHWPNEDACFAEMEMLLSKPHIAIFNMPENQRSHLALVCDSFIETLRSGALPSFAPELRETSCGDVTGMTWGQVFDSLSTSVPDCVEKIFMNFPWRSSNSPIDLEAAYQYLITNEIRNVIGVMSSFDSDMPLVDYVSARLQGVSAEELMNQMDPALKTACVHSLLPINRRETDHHARIHNLFGNDPVTSVSHRQNKASVQELLGQQGLKRIRSASAFSAEEAKRRCLEMGIHYPVVVKPVNGRGSKYVTLCYCDDDLKMAFHATEASPVGRWPHAECMVAEEYIEGDEYVVDVVSFEGTHVVTDMWRSWKYPKKVGPSDDTSSEAVKRGGGLSKDMPRACGDADVTAILYDAQEFVLDLHELDINSEERRVVDYTLKCLDVLGMRYGFSHCEVRIDNRAKSKERGMPVLIELNPRMQGDSPRATGLVGYDAFTLMMYLAFCAATFPKGKASAVRDEHKMAGAHSLPWPPVPQLYYSPRNKDIPVEDRITRYILFLCANKHSYVNMRAARVIESLPTFRHLTRGRIFSPLAAAHAYAVSETVDLYTCPGACILEGRRADIMADVAMIRRLENKPIPEILALCERAMELSESASQLLSHPGKIPPTDPAVKPASVAEEGSQSAATELPCEGLHHSECQSSLPHVETSAQRTDGESSSGSTESELMHPLSEVTEWMLRRKQVMAEYKSVAYEARKAFDQLKEPPLFVSRSDWRILRCVGIRPWAE